MKKTLLVVAIVIFIIVGGIIEQNFINKTFTQLDSKAIEIYNLLQAEEYNSALAKTKEMKNWWEIQRDWLEFLCPNNDVKEIIREMGELEGSQLAQMYDDSITRANVLSAMANNSKNLLQYKWKNVL